jgi:hypothetical protein
LTRIYNLQEDATDESTPNFFPHCKNYNIYDKRSTSRSRRVAAENHTFYHLKLSMKVLQQQHNRGIPHSSHVPQKSLAIYNLKFEAKEASKSVNQFLLPNSCLLGCNFSFMKAVVASSKNKLSRSQTPDLRLWFQIILQKGHSAWEWRGRGSRKPWSGKWW